ncbi:MAG TPA: hypothetical protein VGR84_17400 [Candidatus Acidoferrales bacterium]|nr:hypothetical protein [Candidatus Acidoferrales bacterium]
MRKGIWLTAAALFFSVSHASVARQPSQAQSTGQSQAGAQAEAQKSGSASPSPAKADPLVEAARKARQAKKAAPAPPVVFTNENMPTSAAAISIVGDASASADSSANARALEAQDAKNDEKMWRQKFAAAHVKLREDKDKLAELKSNFYALGLARYFNETDTVARQQAMLAQEKQVEADQKAIDDLEDSLRKAGGDPTWGR